MQHMLTEFRCIWFDARSFLLLMVESHLIKTNVQRWLTIDFIKRLILLLLPKTKINKIISNLNSNYFTYDISEHAQLIANAFAIEMSVDPKKIGTGISVYEFHFFFTSLLAVDTANCALSLNRWPRFVAIDFWFWITFSGDQRHHAQRAQWKLG